MTSRSRVVFAMSTIVVGAALAVATLAAQGPGRAGRGMGPGRGPGPLPMLQRLDLTDAQKEEVRAILAERPARADRQALGKLEQSLMVEVMADTPDTAKIETLKTSIAEAEATALNDRVELQLRIAQLLTPEQRQKARERPAGPGRRAL